VTGAAIDALVDDLAIRRVLASYCQLLDDGKFDALSELFTPDGSFSYAGAAVSGRAAIEEWFTSSQPPERRGKHLTLNVLIDVDGDHDHDHATVTSDYLWVRSVGGDISLGLAGRYQDTLVRTDEGCWLIARRVAQPMTDMEEQASVL
jgi:hypothetical protein